MANTDIVTREDIGNGLAINANKLEADFTKVASKNDLLTKADLVGGKVPASQLPSFIDEIQEFPSIATFPITGQSDFLYVALDTNKLYRWSGTAYVDLSALAGMPDFALNANVVHKTLDETIDGIKSFNSSIYAQDGLSLKNNNAPLLQTGRTILYSNASQFGFLNGNDKGAIFLYNNPNSLVYVLPSQTGTLALLSDLTPYLLIATALNTYQTLSNLSGDLTASATKYPSVNAVNTGLATKFNNPTGTVSQYLRGDGSVANFPFIPTLIWGNIGGTLLNQTDLQSALDGKFNNPTGTTGQYVRGDGSIAVFPAPYGLLPTGGEAGQILTKVDATNYNATWMDNYALWTSVVRHEIKAGEVISKGQAVYISPIQDGTNMIVIKADYSQESTSSKTLGLVMQSLANNAFGQVVTEGLLGNLNTIGANQGDPVWLGANGTLIYGLANKPVAPNHLVFIGIVTRVNANNGEIFVKVQNGFELEELHNVKIVNKANNEVLAYEQSSGLWKNKAINDLIGYVPANNNNVVHLDGNETVGGNKTFAGATAIGGLFINEAFGYANIATHTQLKTHADFFHFNASSNNKGAKFIYGTVGQRVYSLPITDGILALTSDLPTLSGLGGVPVTRTITINGVTYDLSANRTWTLSSADIATALGYTPLAVESDPIFVASPAYGITSLLIANWNTAYGWGNHAGLYSLLGHTHTFASLTSKPTTLAGYGITDSATSAQGAKADTAFGWGNHASAGYLLASNASTLYQSKDADLTAIAGLLGATGLLRKTALDTWSLDTNAYLTGITSGQVTTALGFTPVPNTRTITINGVAYDLSADRAWTIAGGVTSFNTRTGAIVLISADVTTALGYTPYNATNPSGYINGITSAMVTGALGYTPYNSSNPSGYISGITSLMVTNALGFTPYNATNPAGYITASGVWTAEGSWKPASLSGSTRLIGKTSPDGGEFGLAYSAGQVHAYVDGFFYQNEGAYRVIDTNSIGSQSVNYANSAGSASTATNITAYTINQSVGTGNSPSFAEGTFGTTAGSTNQGIQIRFANAFSGYGRIRFYENDSNTQTIHCFSAAWQGGGLGTTNSAGGINIAGTAGVTFGNWNSCDGYVKTGGEAWFRGTVYASSFRGNANQSGTGEAVHAPAGIYSTGNNWLYGNIMMNGYSISGVNTISAGGLITGGTLRSNSNIYIDQNVGNTLVGAYNSTVLQGVFAMGDAYKLTPGGGAGNLYGLAWSHPNAGGVASNLNTHGLLVMENGTFLAAISGSIRARDDMRAPAMFVNGNAVIHAGNIGSQSVSYASTAGNVNSISSAVGGAYSWTGINYFQTDQGTSAVNNSNSAKLQAYSTGNNSAFMSFHRGGYYAINMGLDSDNVFRIGGWSAGANRLQLDMSGNLTVAGNMNATYFYGSGSIRCGDMWGGAGLYRSIGPMVFGTEGNNWIFSNQAVTKAEISAGGIITAQGKIQGEYIYSSGWMYSSGGNTGWLQDNQNQGIRAAGYNTSFGTIATYGASTAGHAGYSIMNNYRTILMQDSSGNFGFYNNDDWLWRLFYNRGNDCWGIGTDNTYSGDGFRCIKYGSAQYGWTTWSDRRAKENIKPIVSALNTVLGMRGVYYNYIKDEAKSEHVGFIAQELIEILPQSVRYAEEIDEYNINYGPIVSVLAEAIKEQNSKIIRLEALVEQLINK